MRSKLLPAAQCPALYGTCPPSNGTASIVTGPYSLPLTYRYVVTLAMAPAAYHRAVWPDALLDPATSGHDVRATVFVRWHRLPPVPCCLAPDPAHPLTTLAGRRQRHRYCVVSARVRRLVGVAAPGAEHRQAVHHRHAGVVAVHVRAVAARHAAVTRVRLAAVRGLGRHGAGVGGRCP